MPTLACMKRLWVHEILRVFGDRLIDEQDTTWLIHQLRSTVERHMEASFDALFEDLAGDSNDPVIIMPLKLLTNY